MEKLESAARVTGEVIKNLLKMPDMVRGPITESLELMKGRMIDSYDVKGDADKTEVYMDGRLAMVIDHPITLTVKI